MRTKKTLINKLALFSYLCFFSLQVSAADGYTFSAGHPSLQKWLLGEVPVPEDNPMTKEKVILGEKLFFDARLSRDKSIACATCHDPNLGWSDGLPTTKGFGGEVLDRASPTIVNSAYSTILMWDGRSANLEDQAIGPMKSSAEMNTDIPELINWLKKSKEYSVLFSRAFPDEEISPETLAKALASFQRTIITSESRFDKWVKGDTNALTEKELRGFRIFVNPEKGNCEVCHSAPNFTDDGFHNLGLASFGSKNPDLGRYSQKPIKLMRGAFKTPTLRNISNTPPYFHDGSAKTLADVIDHYVKGGVDKSNLSPNMKKLSLTEEEQHDLLAFLDSISSPATFTNRNLAKGNQ